MHQDNCGYLCMIIQPAMKEDAGWYTVSAKNEAGIVSSTARLDVHSESWPQNTYEHRIDSSMCTIFPPCTQLNPHLLCLQLSGSNQTSPNPRRCVRPPAATPRWQREGWTWRQPSSPTPARCSPAAWWRVTTCRDMRSTTPHAHPSPLKAALAPSTSQTNLTCPPEGHGTKGSLDGVSWCSRGFLLFL